MVDRRVIAMNLDAFDMALADRFASEGKLPLFSKLMARAAHFEIEQGPGNAGRDTGRTGEHIAVGLKPESTGLYAPFVFRPDDYSVVQKHTPETPYARHLGCKTVVFDPTYFDLEKCENVDGIVGWSGHDPGALPSCRPSGLAEEIEARFGPPDLDQALLHCNVYQSEELTKLFADNVIANTKKRLDIIEWMVTERFTNWDYAMLSIEESHDAIEHLYFGTDPEHPYANLPSAPIAREGLERIYHEICVGVERIMSLFPDATFVIYSMHGMGANRNDTPSMVLLPELLFRARFNETLFVAPEHWASKELPILGTDENWFNTIFANMKPHPLRKLRRVPNKLMRTGNALLGKENEPLTGFPRERNEFPPVYVPGSHYRRYWPQMRAFALPSLHNGIIRLNIKGRERDGIVDARDYESTLDEVEAILLACKDTTTGKPVVRELERPGKGDPYSINDLQGDLVVHWDERIYGLTHSELGQIGPLPIWRTGGHTGGGGRLFIVGDGINPGAYGDRSSYDVAPTIVDLLEGRALNRMDGESVLPVLA